MVVDFNNRTSYATGWLGRTFADALSMELMRTGTFEVIKRQQVEQVMSENNLTIPLDWSQQAMIAERLSSPTGECNYTVSGDIEEARIFKTKEGTLAEVAVRMLVISRVTGMPINGAYVVQSSSPKIGYSGNNDVLVHEALATAAFQAVMKLMDNRLPIGTILTSPRNGEIVIKGGSTTGFREGMECTSIRRSSLTGRIRLTEVTPNESTGVVLEESKGIGPGDKVIPIFEFASASLRVKKKAIGAAGMEVAALAAAALLVGLINTQNHDNGMQNPTAPSATPLADAAFFNYNSSETMTENFSGNSIYVTPAFSQTQGANLITWPQPTTRVAA